MTNQGPIDRLLAAIAAGSMPLCDAYAERAQLDATVPGWRFRRNGAESILREYANWFAHPGVFDELRRVPIERGEVVEYLLRWVEDGVDHASHHMHILEVDADHIVNDTVMCGGRWPAKLLAEMESANRA